MQHEKVLRKATLCFLRRANQVLLAIKTKHIGVGSFNGYGGGIEEGESGPQAAVRELFQESTIIADEKDLEQVALLHINNTRSDGATFPCDVYVYALFKWKGEPKASEEMADPTWFGINDLPIESMMLADLSWLPLVLSGYKVTVAAHYGPFQKTLLGEVDIEIVEDFNGAAL